LEWDTYITVLMQLGLTQNQAKIYLTLHQKGVSTVNQIAKSSSIGREEIYRSIPKLQQIGLIESIIEKPSRFKATPLKTAIRTLLQTRKEEYLKIEEKANELLSSALQQNQQPTEQEQNQNLVLFSGKERLMKLSTDLLKNTKSSLEVICTFPKLLGWIQTHQKIIEQLLEREISVRFIVEAKEDSDCKQVAKILELLTKKKAFQYKTAPDIKACLALYDDTQITISSQPKTPAYKSEVYWSANPSLIELGRAYFEALWKPKKLH